VSEPNIRRLRVFAAVAVAENISAAAAVLGRSQSAITQSIQALEQDLGATLFTRTKSGAFLTHAGEILIQRVKTALGAISDAVEEISDFDKKECSRIMRAISTVHLRALINVTEYGGFTKAAKAGCLAAPTIHRAARELEKIVGVALFEKTSFGVQPTRSAIKLGAAGGRAFSEIQQANVEIAAFKGIESGETVIGAMPLARAFLAPMAAMELCERRPGHRVAIVEAPYETLLNDLKRGRIDLLIGAARGAHKAPGIVEEPFFHDKLSILMRPEHPLAAASRLTAKRLAAYPWVAPRQSSPLRVHFEALFVKHAAPVEVVECNSLVAARIMLMNSDRLMLLSDAQAQIEIQSALIISKALPGRAISRSISLTFRKDWRPTAVQQDLVDIIRRLAGKNYGRMCNV
jgi:LysR family transcriptional regulator, regulator for genes of the gallate degradation pathway